METSGKTFIVVFLIIISIFLMALFRFPVTGSFAEKRVKRVVGGTSTSETGQWPWLVGLTAALPVGYKDILGWRIITSYTYVYCGGALVSDQWVLTAGHCFSTLKAPASVLVAQNWLIQAGRPDFGHSVVDELKDYLGKVFNLASWRLWTAKGQAIVISPNFTSINGLAIHGDLALVKLDQRLPIASGSSLDASSLPPDGVDGTWPANGDNCVMQGWGCTVEGGSLSLYANQVTLPVVSNTQCNQIYSGQLDSSHLCAGFSFDNTGLCAGDSGGPLMCLYNGVYKQAGLASFATSTRSASTPGVFTRITSYRNWIISVISS